MSLPTQIDLLEFGSISELELVKLGCVYLNFWRVFQQHILYWTYLFMKLILPPPVYYINNFSLFILWFFNFMQHFGKNNSNGSPMINIWNIERSDYKTRAFRKIKNNLPFNSNTSYHFPLVSFNFMQSFR